MLRANQVGRARRFVRTKQLAVARTLPLSMSLLAQTGIEQRRESDIHLLQLLADDQRVRLHIGSTADASFDLHLLGRKTLECVSVDGQAGARAEKRP